MGQLFGQGLTVPGSAITDPNTGQTSIGKPSDVLGATAPAIANRANQQETSNIFGNQDQSKGLPSIGTPSFPQAAQAGAMPGSANILSPGLNKAGKLVTLLTTGLQGAMAGRAKSEETVAATGGRRSGGAGMGFEAGYTLPWQRAGMENQLAQQQAQTELTKQQATMVPNPYGGPPIPQALAKVLFPAQIRAGATEEAAKTRAGATTEAAETRGEASKDVARINQGMAIPVDQSTARLAGFPELAGQQVGKGTWGNINKALEAKGYHTQDMGKNGTDENSGMWLMDKAGERISQVSPNSLTYQRSATYAQTRPVQVAADPNNPGNITYTSAANAMQGGMTAPSSAAPAAAKSTAKSATSGPIGDQINAFNTAIQHAQLLTQVATALKNGDVRTIAGLKNRLQSEFGSSNLNDFNTVANVYNNEINKMLGGGNATIEDLKTSGATLPSNANLDTLLSAIGNYKKLAQSKLNVTKQRVQQGMQGKPNFPTNAPPSGVTHVWTPQGLQPAQ